MRATFLLLTALWLPPATATPPVLVLPPGEPVAPWQAAAELVGLQVASPPSMGAATLRVVGDAWRLDVADTAGEVHEVSVAPPPRHGAAGRRAVVGP